MSYLRLALASAADPLLFSLPAAAEKRVALVVGNSNYAQVGTLANPANDANDISSALKSAGFEVILGIDVDKREFDARKVRNFADLLGRRRRRHLLLCRDTGCRWPGATTSFRSMPGCRASATSTSTPSISISS